MLLTGFVWHGEMTSGGPPRTRQGAVGFFSEEDVEFLGRLSACQLDFGARTKKFIVLAFYVTKKWADFWL